MSFTTHWNNSTKLGPSTLHTSAQLVICFSVFVFCSYLSQFLDEQRLVLKFTDRRISTHTHTCKYLYLQPTQVSETCAIPYLWVINSLLEKLLDLSCDCQTHHPIYQ